MPPENSAAWLRGRRQDLSVAPAPYPAVGAKQVVIRNHAIAVNPVDWIVQSTPRLIYGWLRGSVVIGSDVAGEVVEVGAEVSRFAVGDRVLGHALGADKGYDHAAEGAFQRYTLLREHMVSPIPPTMPYTEAAALPLGVSTAACALFQPQQLHLARPTPAGRPVEGTVLVWGAATSVGANATQLARAAGYEVIATCSPGNDAFVRGLGASQTFDYRSGSVVDDLVRAFSARKLAGVIALGNGSAQPCIEVASRCEGRRLVAQASTAVSFAGLRDRPWTLPVVMSRVGLGQARALLAARRGGVTTTFIAGASLADDDVSTLIYRDFLPAALAEKRHRPAPEPLVCGTGLGQLQAALDRQRAGVSARKIVVSLDEPHT